MLSAEKNKILTQVGPGTPMGDYLRRYWQPIGGASELDANPIKAIRLLGEDLVLYKDLGGKYGLIDRNCPHRRADLSYGMVEETGIRCNYHGWLMDEAGNVIEQPYDDTVNPRGKNARALPRQGLSGEGMRRASVRLYGPAAGAGAADLGAVHLGERFPRGGDLRHSLQLVPVPGELLRSRAFRMDARELGRAHQGQGRDYAARHLKLVFEEFDYGFVYKRVREGQKEGDPVWTVGRVTLWPNGFYLGNHFEWRVPIDDENTLSVCWFFMRVPKGREPYVQDKVPTWVSPIKDETGRWISSHVINQDIIAWVGQGVIADRTKENLGASDLGIAMMRKRLFDELDAVARGEEPKAVVRSSNVAKCIELPNITKKTSTEGITLAEFPEYPLLNARLKGFRHCYGQPPEVRKAFAEAMGIEA